MPIDVSVVVATRDRLDLLRGSLAALRRQETPRAYEIIVVDDRSRVPIRPEDVEGAKLVLGPGEGPGAARNAGIAVAQGRIVAFTDDDTEADPGWLEAAAAFLDAHPDHPAVHGPITSLPWDPLHAYSVHTDAPGKYWTANMAYRRAALDALGGFAPDLPNYHGEDVDLAFRALDELGPIGWVPAMHVLHHPREQSFADLARRGRHAGNEVTLFRRHAKHFGGAARLPTPWLFPYANLAVVWGGELRGQLPGILLRPGRLARLVGIAVGQAFYATRALVGLARASRASS